MLSINTNLSSLIAQNSMKTSTDKLNQAIERMTTGLKINHASDNAANYSISTNLTTQLSAYDVAADNVAMGMDLVNYASDILSQMQDKAARLNALSTQARNGTYGSQSLSALNSEASAIMSELMRLYSTAEYNDISLFNRTAYTIAPHLPQAAASGFIDETALISPTDAGPTTDAPVAKYDGFIEDPKHPNGDAYVDGLTSVTEALATTGLTSGGEYKVGGVEDLKALATYVNGGNDTSGMTFIMSEDIDLSGEANWTPIGDYSTNSSYIFNGSFDGNGHVIKNLKIDRETSRYQGLFGYANGGEIKNVGLEGVNIKGADFVGGLVGFSYSLISNSYATGAVSGDSFVGGLAGQFGTTITNCYSTANITGKTDIGGFIGYLDPSTVITNCYSTGNIIGNDNIGGLVGISESSITNSYATGNVSGTGDYVGGLVGWTDSTITNSYATGTVSGTERVGGLAGQSSSISNSYATGAVSGTDDIGGLVGYTTSGTSITNSYATGNVTGQGSVGGLVGYSHSTISNSYANGDVNGTSYVGGLAGSADTIINSYATGAVSGTDDIGGLAGSANYSISNSYATGDVTGNGNVGGLIGDIGNSIINSYATGTVNGTTNVGGLVGNGYVGGDHVIENSYATGNVQGYENIGGIVGNNTEADDNHLEIISSYAKGNVTGHKFVGGIIGYTNTSLDPYDDMIIHNCASYSHIISGNEAVGSIIGGWVGEEINGYYTPGTIIMSNNTALSTLQGTGNYYTYDADSDDYILDSTYDLSSYNSTVRLIQKQPTETNLQVGIYGNSSSQLSFDTNFSFDLNIDAGIESVDAFNAIVAFENLLSEKATQLGAVQNRLDSALESIEVNINNLTSSRSTIRDADIAEVSSDYIRQQILQQASATLMATANQSPAIALQLI